MSDLYITNPTGTRQRDAAGRSLPGESTSQTRIQTPREIMAARNAREARRAQQTGLDDTTRRRQQEDIVGVGAVPTNTRQTTQIPTNNPNTTTTTRYPTTQSVTIGGRTADVPVSNGMTQRVGNPATAQGQTRPALVDISQGPATAGDPRTQRDRTEAFEKLSMPAVAGAKAPQPQAANYPQTTLSTQPPSRAGFPHAFERWEQLSSHWEGLTSYWLRRLQENTNELDGKPIDKQMARQITDLSAAGANLFHAVVELQRLRASSERKFQRWFFETRNEQEQAQEKIAELQNQLQAERSQPRQVTGDVEAVRAERIKADELVKEMRRELQISKEEARRAWEELGRREQEERERTMRLRSGEPTLIGGVQVLPMQGLSSRHNTTASDRPVTRDGPYPGGPTETMMGGQQRPRSRSRTSLDSPLRGDDAKYSYRREATASPTDTDPFTERTRQQPEPPLPLRHEPDTRFYSPTAAPSLPPPLPQSLTAGQRAAIASPVHSSAASQSARRELASSGGPSYIPSTHSDEEEEEYHIGPDGNFILDDRGRRIPYRQPLTSYEEIASDDEDHTADIERERVLQQQYAQRRQGPGQSRQQYSAPSTNAPGLSINPVMARSQGTSSALTGHYHDQVTSPTTTTSAPTRAVPAAPVQPNQQITPEQYQQPFSGTSPASTVSSLTPGTITTRLVSPGRQPPTTSAAAADYSGEGYGPSLRQHPATSATAPPQVLSPTLDPAGEWESIQGMTSHHRHPTRLSDILEERTSPSRGSYAGSNEGRTRR